MSSTQMTNEHGIRALEYCGALGCCVVIAVCTLYVARSTAQSSINASPIYGITIPAGYRDWRLIAVGHLAGGSLKQLRAQLGNDIAIKAFREGKLPFPDGTIIAALHWNEALSDENNKVLASGFPGAGLQSSVAGNAGQVGVDHHRISEDRSNQVSVLTDGDNLQPGDEALHKTCFPCHEPAKDRDLVFARYAPTP